MTNFLEALQGLAVHHGPIKIGAVMDGVYLQVPSMENESKGSLFLLSVTDSEAVVLIQEWTKDLAKSPVLPENAIQKKDGEPSIQTLGGGKMFFKS